MIVEHLLGRRVTLTVRTLAADGAYLASPPGADDDQPGDLADDGDEVLLLPAAEVPAEAKPGDALTVFVRPDPDLGLVATTRPVALAVGEVAFLEIADVSTIGAFVEIGLDKQLLVPFAQQSRPLRVGEREPIGMYVDKTGRLAGTMQVSGLFADPDGWFAQDEWVDGVAWRNDPDIGLFVIVERSYVGLMPASEPHRLARGEAARFRIALVLPDGRLVLSLRDHAHKQLESDAARILAVLRGPSPPQVGDHSDPEQLRALFGLSKKAFKRAVGRLLKARAVQLDDAGHVTVVAP
jgi:uncharacterized protein